MKVFWKGKDLTDVEAQLLSLCLEAHGQSVFRQNVSSMCLQMAAQGSMDYTKSITAALCSLGGMHAPLMASWQVLQIEELPPLDALRDGKLLLAGWGNSFEKGKVDPIWEPVLLFLREHYKALAERIDSITKVLHEAGKKIFPNPSVLTAAVGIALNLPPQLLPWMILQGRLDNWSRLFAQSLQSAEKGKA